MIHTIKPAPLRVGGRVTISGNHFGSTRGNVELLLSGRRYICDIDTWNDTRIEAIIPDHLDDAIGSSAKTVRLWVKLHGSSLGPNSDVQIHPPRRAPRVLDLSSDEIVPGSSVAIAGRDFGERGSVDFAFGGRTFRGTVSEWGNVLIVAVLPEGSDGLPRTRGQVVVRNSRGETSSHAITFVPAVETFQISMYYVVDGSASVMPTVKTAHFFEHFTMRPGWVVKSYRKEIVRGRGSMDYMLEPTPGTQRIPVSYTHLRAHET